MFSRCAAIKIAFWLAESRYLLAAGVFSDSFGAFADSMLSQFTRQEKTNSRLDFPRGDGLLLVLERQARCFRCDALEDVIDEGVHDAHGLG